MRKFNFIEGEVLLLNKPYKWTSFDVVNKVRNAIKIKKVGHAGTLDPLATGLLIVCTGKFTKKINEYQDREKEYTGTITLGATTPSFDLETEVDQTFDLKNITEEKIKHAAKSLEGKYGQMPPFHSAKMVNGERAYLKARRGETFEMKTREVEVKAFEITGIEMPFVHFRIECSKGTYIRSLARDLGESLSNGAHLSSLCRTRIGEFSLSEAFELKDFIDLVHKQKAMEAEDSTTL
jgi:tRNA pseudouridine55 synthase